MILSGTLILIIADLPVLKLTDLQTVCPVQIKNISNVETDVCILTWCVMVILSVTKLKMKTSTCAQMTLISTDLKIQRQHCHVEAKCIKVRNVAIQSF